MAAYAKTADVEAGFRALDAEEQNRCSALLTEAGVLIDAVALDATLDAKRVASCRMVRRAIGDGSTARAFPLGATQGGVSALGYAQNWTLSGGSTGELYLSKVEKRLLGVGNRIGSYSPVEGMVDADV